MGTSFFPCCFAIIHIKYHNFENFPAGATCIPWNTAYIVMYILHLIMTLPKITFYQFRNVPIEHLRRVRIADRDTYSSGQLTRPMFGLQNLLRPFPADFWTLGLNLLRYSIWHVKVSASILGCHSYNRQAEGDVNRRFRM